MAFCAGRDTSLTSLKMIFTVKTMLFAWYLTYRGMVESASVNATLPSSTAILNGTKIDFVLDAFDPAPPNLNYTLLKFGYEKTGEAFARLYNYKKIISAFTLYSSIPPEFVGRLTTSKVGGKPMISVSPILFTDETYQFYFELDYETASGVAQVYSQKYQLQNVYSMPTFNDAESMQASTTLIEGSTGTIQCVVSSRPISTVTWSYNNATINATQSSTTSTSGSIIKVTSVLRISNPSLSLDGEQVTCFASHQFSAAGSHTTTINVHYAPDQPRITAIATKPVTGTAVTLTCSARATPAAHFRFLSGNGSVLQDGANANFVISSLNYVEFTNYSATYGCIAYNSYGEAPLQEIVLGIQVPPVISFSINPSTVNETNNATMQCTVTAANPAPSITIQNPKGQILSHTDGLVQLDLITREHSGTYSCIASNGVVGSPVARTAILAVNRRSTATESERTNSTQLNAHAIGLYAVLAFCIPITFLLTMWNIALRRRIKLLQDDQSKGKTQSPHQDLDYEVIGYTNLRFESNQQSHATTADTSQTEVVNNGSNNNAVYMELGPRCKDEQTYTPLSSDTQTTSPSL